MEATLSRNDCSSAMMRAIFESATKSIEQRGFAHRQGEDLQLGHCRNDGKVEMPALSQI